MYAKMVKNFKNNRCFSTNKILKNFLPKLLIDIEKNYLKNPNLIINFWPEIIGKKLASMTEVKSFENKVLYVLVKSSTLYSILTLHEKKRLLNLMQEKFSKDVIKNIVFRIG